MDEPVDKPIIGRLPVYQAHKGSYRIHLVLLRILVIYLYNNLHLVVDAFGCLTVDASRHLDNELVDDYGLFQKVFTLSLSPSSRTPIKFLTHLPT
jgi:hypothetical protein